MKKGKISILRAFLGILLVISGIFHFYNYFTGTYAAVSEYMNGVVLVMGIIQLFFGIIALFWDKIKIFRGKEKRMIIVFFIILVVGVLIAASSMSLLIKSDTEKFYGTWELVYPSFEHSVTVTFNSNGTFEEVWVFSDYNVTFKGIWKFEKRDKDTLRTEDIDMIGILANKNFYYTFSNGNNRLELTEYWSSLDDEKSYIFVKI